MSHSDDNDTRSLIAPCQTVGLDAPMRWVKLGWEDFKQVPRLSGSYGLVMVLISLIIAYVAFQAHSIVVAIAMLGGFFFIGPSLAIGLYSISRQLSNGQTPLLMRCVREGHKNLSNELVLSFMCLIVFLLWARAASMVHIFFPNPETVTASNLGMFLTVGTAVGAIFAGVIFCVCAFSIPMMMDRNIDAVTAALTSISAVLRNKVTMIVWGMLIMASVVIGLLLGFIGLAVTLPVIGHATWHAYQEVIDSDAWELNPIGKADDNYR